MFLNIFLAKQRECISMGGLLHRFLLVLNLRWVGGLTYGCPGVTELRTGLPRLGLNILVFSLIGALVLLDPGELARCGLRGSLWLRILLNVWSLRRLFDGSLFGIFLNPPIPALDVGLRHIHTRGCTDRFVSLDLLTSRIDSLGEARV